MDVEAMRKAAASSASPVRSQLAHEGFDWRRGNHDACADDRHCKHISRERSVQRNSGNDEKRGRRQDDQQAE